YHYQTHKISVILIVHKWVITKIRARTIFSHLPIMLFDIRVAVSQSNHQGRSKEDRREDTFNNTDELNQCQITQGTNTHHPYGNHEERDNGQSRNNRRRDRPHHGLINSQVCLLSKSAVSLPGNPLCILIDFVEDNH